MTLERDITRKELNKKIHYMYEGIIPRYIISMKFSNGIIFMTSVEDNNYIIERLKEQTFEDFKLFLRSFFIIDEDEIKENIIYI